MEQASFDFIADLASDPANGWSIGSLGAIGEFVRDPGEPVDIRRGTDRIEIVTARGAMRIDRDPAMIGVAWDSLSADGESWGHALAFCLPRPDSGARVVCEIGTDRGAIRREDAEAVLFDMGVGSGCVRMCARTTDPDLIAALRAAEGRPLLAVHGIMGAVLSAQPHRIMLAPSARIEVYQPIPPADGKSPEGRHTHLLTKLTPKDRPHSANVPIPDGWQSALSMHPQSPWRTVTGKRHPFEPGIDAAFAPILERFGLPEDRAVAAALAQAVEESSPHLSQWPDSRRGRATARIVLRRLAAAGNPRVKPRRVMHDRAPIDIEEGEEA
jgi:hypothetical protein